MRSRAYESQSIILEVEVIGKPVETGRFNTYSGIPCTVTGIENYDFRRRILNEQIVIEWHHSGLQDFSKGDILRVHATPKGIEDLTVFYPRRIDKIDEMGKMISRHFC